MSHWTRAKVKINVNAVNETLLLSALEILAKEIGGKVAKNVIVRGFRHSVQCPYAVLCTLPYGNGYGILLSDELTVVVDEHGAPLSAAEFAERLTQLYTALAVISAAQSLQMEPQLVSETKERIVLDLVRW
ncbi:MAG: hypothetical protein QXG48_00490 [Thermofilaceae archaeon]